MNYQFSNYHYVREHEHNPRGFGVWAFENHTHTKQWWVEKPMYLTDAKKEVVKQLKADNFNEPVIYVAS